MVVLIQVLFFLLMVPILEDLTDEVSLMQDPYDNVEVANPIVVFIVEFLFVTFIVDCFCLCLFTFLDFFKDEDTDNSEKNNGWNKPDLPHFFKEESDISEFSLNENPVKDLGIVNLHGSDDRLNELESIIDLFSKTSLTATGPVNIGYESTSTWCGELGKVTKQKRHTLPFRNLKKKLYKTVLVPNRQKINLLVILRRKHALEKKVQVCSAFRYTSLSDILLAGNCVEINDLYISVTNFEEECSTSQVKRYEEIDFENAVKTVYAPTRKKPQAQKCINVSYKKKKQQKSDLNEN